MTSEEFQDCLRCGRFYALKGLPYCDSCNKDLTHQLQNATQAEGVLLAVKIAKDMERAKE